MLVFLFIAAAYPEESITHAQYRDKANAHECYKLIYKNGCKETRTGVIETRVSIDAHGKVVTLTIVKNAIRRDPKLVEKCVVKEVKGWTFPEPGDADPVFTMTLRFGDKC